MKFHDNLKNLFWENLIINYIRKAVISPVNTCWFLLSYIFLMHVFKLCSLWIRASCHLSCVSLWVPRSFSVNEIITACRLILLKSLSLKLKSFVSLLRAIFMCILSYFPHCFGHKHFRKGWYKVILKRCWNIWISNGICKRNGESMTGQRVKLQVYRAIM